jgi:hypothetical protein
MAASTGAWLTTLTRMVSGSSSDKAGLPLSVFRKGLPWTQARSLNQNADQMFSKTSLLQK